MIEAREAAKGRVVAITFGVVDLVAGFLVYVGVFEGLPVRYWLVDGGAALVVMLFTAAGVGLLAKTPWAPRAALVTSVVSLVLGLLLVSTLALTASYLSGIYGPVGRGGSLILGFIAAMALPYLVVLPLAQLAWLRRGPAGASSALPES